jgi:hypothetical protein
MMANKIVGLLFLLVAGGFGLFYFGTVFQHGYNEGVIRMRHGDAIMLGLGMAAFFIASVTLLLRKRPG